jgi:predicted DsbA family dithiol-disulfide isomerase
MGKVRFNFDVVCPYSYMEGFAVEAIQDEGAVEIEWLPFKLRPAPRPLLEVRGDHLREIRGVADAAGVRGVPTLVTEDGESHWAWAACSATSPASRSCHA